MLRPSAELGNQKEEQAGGRKRHSGAKPRSRTLEAELEVPRASQGGRAGERSGAPVPGLHRRDPTSRHCTERMEDCGWRAANESAPESTGRKSKGRSFGFFFLKTYYIF